MCPSRYNGHGAKYEQIFHDSGHKSREEGQCKFFYNL